MKQVREVVDTNGVVWRQVTTDSDKTSFDQMGDLLQDVNMSLGRSLTPFSITGGFSVSGSWILFGLIFLMPEGFASQTMFGIWLLSLFVRIR